MASVTRNREFYRIVGTHLRAIRESKGIARAALTRHLGFDESWLWCIETGRNRIALDVLIEACKYMRVDPADVITNIARLTADVPRETST